MGGAFPSSDSGPNALPLTCPLGMGFPSLLPILLVPSQTAHTHPLTRVETPPINAERTRKPGPRSQMESGVRRLVSDNGDRSYVLVGARSNFWSDGDLLGEVESHHTTGALGIEVRTAWLEHTVQSSDTDQAAVIQ